MADTNFCTGLIAFRQTKASLEFLEMWDEALLENPQLNQPIFNRLIGDHPDLLKTVTLPFSKFPNGALHFSGTFRGEVMDNKEDVYIVHNNFIQGHENKVDRFKAHGLWSEQWICTYTHFQLRQCQRQLSCEQFVFVATTT